MLGMDVKDRVLMREDQPLDARLGHGRERGLELVWPSNLDPFEVETQGLRRIPRSAESRPGGSDWLGSREPPPGRFSARPPGARRAASRSALERGCSTP